MQLCWAYTRHVCNCATSAPGQTVLTLHSKPPLPVLYKPTGLMAACCMMQELRIEDCTSEAGADAGAPWDDTMRLMPPLLELADMFNIILRRCANSRADSDLVRGDSACLPPNPTYSLTLGCHV